MLYNQFEDMSHSEQTNNLYVQLAKIKSCRSHQAFMFFEIVRVVDCVYNTYTRREILYRYL